MPLLVIFLYKIIIYNFEYIILFKYHCLNSVLIGLVISLLIHAMTWGKGSLIKKLMMWSLKPKITVVRVSVVPFLSFYYFVSSSYLVVLERLYLSRILVLVVQKIGSTFHSSG